MSLACRVSGQLHFTPTGGSWLNLVERWFREITDKPVSHVEVGRAPAAVAAAVAEGGEH